jgi:TatD DNase family protein
VVDTHAHIALCEAPPAEVVAAARRVGVGRILTIGLDAASNDDAVRIASENPEVFAAVGRHPNSATGFDDAAAEQIERLAAHDRVRAIGETGLDFFRDNASEGEQVRAFEAQIGIASRTGLPLVIHMRDVSGAGAGRAVADTFELLAAEAEDVDVILHCFSATPERAKEAADRGWFVSFAGNVTYPNAEPLREAAALVPDRLLLAETDSPYLTPQPVRGERNEPANVTMTADALAEVRGVGPERISEIVEANAAGLFGW